MPAPPFGPPALSRPPDPPSAGSRRCLRPVLHPRPAGADGFSLVEVVVATGLFMTAIVSLAQLFVLATRANAAAGEMTEATVFAAQKIEELRAAPFPSVLGSQSVDYLDSRGERLGGSTAAGRRAYARRWWIESLASSTAASTVARTVAVTVVVSRYRRGDRGMSSSGARPGEGAFPGETVPQEIVRVVTLRTSVAP